VRVVIAEELVKQGYSQRNTAEILGITPAAVTQYTMGKRGKNLSEMIRSMEETSLIIRNLTDQIIERRKKGDMIDEFPSILDAAYKIMRLVSEKSIAKGKVTIPKRENDLSRVLKERIEQEHLAARRNMTLAAGAKDEIAKMVFRQIATDSIRHADIISFLMNYQSSDQIRKSSADEIAQIQAMIKEEESATEQPIKLKDIDPALKLLLKSIDIDEEKHKMLLTGLLGIYRSR
jgi:predicted transcriptional regulator